MVDSETHIQKALAGYYRCFRLSKVKYEDRVKEKARIERKLSQAEKREEKIKLIEHKPGRYRMVLVDRTGRVLEELIRGRGIRQEELFGHIDEELRELAGISSRSIDKPASTRPV